MDIAHLRSVGVGSIWLMLVGLWCGTGLIGNHQKGDEVTVYAYVHRDEVRELGLLPLLDHVIGSRMARWCVIDRWRCRREPEWCLGYLRVGALIRVHIERGLML